MLTFIEIFDLFLLGTVLLIMRVTFLGHVVAWDGARAKAQESREQETTAAPEYGLPPGTPAHPWPGASPTRRAMTMAGNSTPTVDRRVASILAGVVTA